jgi:thymidine kinase
MDFSDGKLELVLGTMFSGKTSYMLSKIAFFADLGFKVLYVNIDFDNRSDKSFSTHNPFLNYKEYTEKGNINKNVLMIKSKNLVGIEFNPWDIILIDEAHFFADLEIWVKELLLNKKYVIVSSLIGDFKGNKFGNASDLIPICDEIVRLQAYCSICAENKKCRVAIYSKKITNNENTIEIGGSEKYFPVCREHYYNRKQELNRLFVNNKNHYAKTNNEQNQVLNNEVNKQ